VGFPLLKYNAVYAIQKILAAVYAIQKKLPAVYAIQKNTFCGLCNNFCSFYDNVLGDALG
jgi:hypothetical protein